VSLLKELSSLETIRKSGAINEFCKLRASPLLCHRNGTRCEVITRCLSCYTTILSRICDSGVVGYNSWCKFPTEEIMGALQ